MTGCLPEADMNAPIYHRLQLLHLQLDIHTAPVVVGAGNLHCAAGRPEKHPLGSRGGPQKPVVHVPIHLAHFAARRSAQQQLLLLVAGKHVLGVVERGGDGQGRASAAVGRAYQPAGGVVRGQARAGQALRFVESQHFGQRVREIAGVASPPPARRRGSRQWCHHSIPGLLAGVRSAGPRRYRAGSSR